MKPPRFWEIAAILAVLAILAFMFFPPTGYPKTLAKRSVCLSNLKRLSLAANTYAVDFDERFPNRDSWWDAVYAYTKSQDVLICPIIFAEKNPQLYGYAFNGALSNAKAPPKPETIPLIFESINLAKNASGDTNSTPNPGRHPHSATKLGCNNIGYADGHAKSVPVH